MEDKELATPSAELSMEKESSYSVIAYLGSELPETYRNMVLAKWLRTLRFGNDFFRLIESDAYFECYQVYIKNLLKRPGCVVRVAVLTDDPDTCLGFSVSMPETLDYVWSHKDNRRIGVATSLIQFPFKYITHLTTVGISIWNKKYPDVKFQPFK